MAANAVPIEVAGEDPEAALQTKAFVETGAAAIVWSAYIDNLTLPSVQASRSDQTSTGTLKLTFDAIGGDLGWTVAAPISRRPTSRSPRRGRQHGFPGTQLTAPTVQRCRPPGQSASYTPQDPCSRH
jgi:hypothetical protein